MTKGATPSRAASALRSLTKLDADALQRGRAFVGRTAATWWAQMRARPVVVRPYRRPVTWRDRLLWLAMTPLLFIFFFVYGFFFALTAPYFIVQCALPIGLVGVIGIWALPDERVAPTRLMRFLFSGYLIAFCLWPSYLAVSLPGLPWITPVRAFGMPLAFLLLISLSISPRFRTQLAAILGATPLIWKAMAAFTAMQFITVPFSKHISASLNKVLIQQVNWTTIFVFSAYMFSYPRRIRRYIYLICFALIPLTFLSYIEFKNQQLLWAGHVPSFLAIADLETILTPEFRPGTGEYRSKALFSTALGLAQFTAVLTPFFLLHVLQPRRVWTFLGSLVALGCIFMCIEYSGSRLGLVGMLWSVLAYIYVLSFMRWRKQRDDVIAPAIFYAYPFFFVLVMMASLTIKPVHDAIWGGNAHAGSNQARIDQIGRAMPQALNNPIGHGAGQSGPAMGYAEGDFVTIDNYMISLVLDYGFIGLISYLVLFIGASAFAFRYAILYAPQSRDREIRYLIPLGVAMSAFLVIKLVFSQIDNDAMLYTFLGMTVGLIARMQREGIAPPPPPPRRRKSQDPDAKNARRLKAIR